MFINSLRLSGYRNYSSIDLKFTSRLVFFVGENGSGKTNILEALGLASYLKSFRENKDNELIQWNNSGYYLKVSYTENKQDHIIEIGVQSEGGFRKKVKFDGNNLKKKTDLIGRIICIIFTPDDLNIIDGGPGQRRKFIDAFISSISETYLHTLMEYNKILKNRNSLLKNKSSDSELQIWTNMLVEKGSYIRNERYKIITELNNYFNKDLMNLSGNKDNFSLKYKSEFQNPEEFQKILYKNLYRDRRLGYTTTGIHRDDISIIMDGKDINEFGSQGQKRSTVISLKTSVFKYIKNYTKRIPVLLIDDVIRELDVKRREYFVNLLLQSGQAFFTTTDLEGIAEYLGNIKEKIQIFKVEEKGVTESAF